MQNTVSEVVRQLDALRLAILAFRSAFDTYAKWADAAESQVQSRVQEDRTADQHNLIVLLELSRPTRESIKTVLADVMCPWFMVASMASCAMAHGDELTKEFSSAAERESALQRLYDNDNRQGQHTPEALVDQFDAECKTDSHNRVGEVNEIEQIHDEAKSGQHVASWAEFRRRQYGSSFRRRTSNDRIDYVAIDSCRETRWAGLRAIEGSCRFGVSAHA